MERTGGHELGTINPPAFPLGRDQPGVASGHSPAVCRRRSQLPRDSSTSNTGFGGWSPRGLAGLFEEPGNPQSGWGPEPTGAGERRRPSPPRLTPFTHGPSRWSPPTSPMAQNGQAPPSGPPGSCPLNGSFPERP